MTNDLTFVSLTPERLDDLATLFDQPGDPKWCWCASFHIRGAVKRRPPAANRAVLTRIAERGPSPGLVAYRSGQPVGWVSLGPREGFEKLASSKALPSVDDRPVWFDRLLRCRPRRAGPRSRTRPPRRGDCLRAPERGVGGRGVSDRSWHRADSYAHRVWRNPPDV